MNWPERLTSDPNICHGRLCVNGTRVMVSVILDNLAAGESFDEIRKSYAVDREDIEACLHYARSKRGTACWHCSLEWLDALQDRREPAPRRGGGFFFRARGHDALTVRDQGMRGYPDSGIASACQAAGREIATLDLDFADARRYPPRS
jgi:uncharacterized protein (DUF433 family)